MTATSQEMLALVLVAFIAGIAVRRWWRARQKQGAAACGGCARSTDTKAPARQTVATIPLHAVQAELRRGRR